MNWKYKTCDDGSGSWFESKIKELDWTYIVENYYQNWDYHVALYLGCGEEVVLKEGLKTLGAAQKYAEKHFQKMVDKIIKNYGK